MEDLLAIESLQLAFNKRNPSPGIMIHTDRGGQFASHNFRTLLTDYKCVQSMSEADNPYDNAFAESLFSRFKAELIQKGAFESKEDAITEIFDYIELYYNTQRLHSSLGYMPPTEFEEKTKPKTL
jgi:transposase InsO family protein